MDSTVAVKVLDCWLAVMELLVSWVVELAVQVQVDWLMVDLRLELGLRVLDLQVRNLRVLGWMLLVDWTEPVHLPLVGRHLSPTNHRFVHSRIGS